MPKFGKPTRQMRICREHLGRDVWFLGFDGETYRATIAGIGRGVVKLVYQVPRAGEVVAYIERQQRNRIARFA